MAGVWLKPTSREETARKDFPRPEVLDEPLVSTEDFTVDNDGRGLVLKSPNGHYWRATIDNAGVVSWADLGTTYP